MNQPAKKKPKIAPEYAHFPKQGISVKMVVVCEYRVKCEAYMIAEGCLTTGEADMSWLTKAGDDTRDITKALVISTMSFIVPGDASKTRLEHYALGKESLAMGLKSIRKIKKAVGEYYARSTNSPVITKTTTQATR